MKFLDNAPPFLFFTGKGGVGKTSLACATAVRLAGSGKRVLLVSTDPASNVGQVFGVSIGNIITPIAGVPGLSALEIDPQAAAQQYRDRIVGPVRGVLSEAVVKGIEEQLSGACTTEIAAFDEFTALLTDPKMAASYDHVLFDTAPTGHTIRLLQLPGAWTGFLDNSPGGASCLGPLSGLEKQRGQYKDAVAALSSPARTRLILVVRAQRSTLHEAARTSEELAAVGLTNQYLVINAVLPEREGQDDALASAVVARERSALAAIPEALRALPADRLPLKSFNLVGLEALRSFLIEGEQPLSVVSAVPMEMRAPGLSSLVDDMATTGHGLIMLMGKGGVGKTTLAAAIAVDLARRGHDVHLTTSDPAAHLIETVEGAVEHLTVSRLDPRAETELYRKRVLETKGKDLDAQGRALLEEDLRSPCTEEIAVFQAFSHVIREAGKCFVVMDTAPTGHTLLLLDATGAYHRDIARQFKDTGRHFTTPMMQLQDPEQTKILIVTLAETTPVLEAAGLQEDLRRAGIEPWAWVVNDSVASAKSSSPLLRLRAAGEFAHIESVAARHARRYAVVPLLAEEPVGAARLLKLVKGQMEKGPSRDAIRQSVRANYAEVARAGSAGGCCAPSKPGMETASCCGGGETAAAAVKASQALGYSAEELADMPEGANMGLGCGNPQAIASIRPGETVLDLGSGGGFDAFLALRRTGPQGKVIGVDMTPEMVDKARGNAAKLKAANVEFRVGEIEHLPVADGSVDVIISNCVINLSPDKGQVFREAFRVLKSGGRLAISDVVACAGLPSEMRGDLELLSGCIAGAAGIDEVERLLKEAGFADISVVPKEASREFIRDWAPGRGVEQYVVSADIRAVKRS